MLRVPGPGGDAVNVIAGEEGPKIRKAGLKPLEHPVGIA
jgi:hypothetical protein